jgi:hypothetical protein
VTQPHVRIDAVMSEIETAVRDDLRRRMIARGGPADFKDPDIFARVSAVLGRAADRRDRDVLLLPELLADEQAWKPAAALNFSSHRPVLGPLLVFVKRRLLLPLMRWLFEYTEENFRRQEYVNRIVMACLEELAIENARLQAEVNALAQEAGGARVATLPPDTPSGGR